MRMVSIDFSVYIIYTLYIFLILFKWVVVFTKGHSNDVHLITVNVAALKLTLQALHTATHVSYLCCTNDYELNQPRFTVYLA